MEFTPKLPPDNVNISKGSHFGEFLTLAGGLLGIVFVLYLVLGFLLDAVIAYWPDTLDMHLGAFYEKALSSKSTPSADERRVQAVLDKLAAELPPSTRQYCIHVQKKDLVNAGAYPGGHIVVFTGLLKEIKSENELAMVLAHELAHYQNHDHLHSFSRGVVTFLFASLLFGEESTITDFLGSTLATVNSAFSRDQERSADEFALELLNKTYGHVGGAVDFFARLEKGIFDLPFVEFLSSHPSSESRVVRLERIIKERGYEIQQTEPLE